MEIESGFFYTRGWFSEMVELQPAAAEKEREGCFAVLQQLKLIFYSIIVQPLEFRALPKMIQYLFAIVRLGQMFEGKRSEEFSKDLPNSAVYL